MRTDFLQFARDAVRDCNEVSKSRPLDEDAALACLAGRVERAWEAGFLAGVADMLARVSPPTSAELTFTYENWKGVVAVRRVRPLHIWYGTTPWYRECWMLRALDLEKSEERDFALDRVTWKS